MNNTFSKEQENQIIEMYKNHTCIDTIIDIFDTEEKYIREILKDNQVDRQYTMFTIELSQRIIDLHQEGLLHKEIREQLLISDVGINKILDRNFIPRMTITQRNRIYDRNSYYFDKIDSQNKAYYIGLLWADGSNNVNHRQIVLSLQMEDSYLIDKLIKELEFEGTYKIDQNAHNKNSKHFLQARFTLQDIYMSEKLESYGMVHNKSLVLQFPTCVPKHLIKHFIRGYFDGDGGVSYDTKRQKGHISIAGTYEVCSEISKLLLEHNIKNNIYHPSQCGNHNTYVINICGNKSCYNFMTWIYEEAETYMVRKYLKLKKIEKRYLETHNK